MKCSAAKTEEEESDMKIEESVHVAHSAEILADLPTDKYEACHPLEDNEIDSGFYSLFFSTK